MDIAPDKAEASIETVKEGMEPTDKAVSASVLQACAAEDREHNRELQNAAHDELADPEFKAFRARIPPRAGAPKEYRKRDPKWTDFVYKIDTAAGEGGFQGGRVLARNKDKS